MLATKEKEEELNGKRYKIVSMSIQSRRDKGEYISHEMEIDLYHAWMKTLTDIKKDYIEIKEEK